MITALLNGRAGPERRALVFKGATRPFEHKVSLSGNQSPTDNQRRLVIGSPAIAPRVGARHLVLQHRHRLRVRAFEGIEVGDAVNVKINHGLM